MEMVLSFLAQLYSISVRHGEDDRLVWNPSKRGLFEVKSYYEVLNRKDGLSFP
jgi:diadenosine tetraphosphatase ApaH/serine/threonine PP2A family protein phosphatase